MVTDAVMDTGTDVVMDAVTDTMIVTSLRQLQTCKFPMKPVIDTVTDRNRCF